MKLVLRRSIDRDAEIGLVGATKRQLEAISTQGRTAETRTREGLRISDNNEESWPEHISIKLHALDLMA